LQFVEQRTALLLALSAALSAASASIVGFDIDGLEARITEQQQLCTDITLLDAHMNDLQAHLATAPTQTVASPALRQAIARLRETQVRVSQLNRSHQLLLQRSRRTASALLRSYQTFIADTYENPASREALAEVV
jgi:hypothetical protein